MSNVRTSNTSSDSFCSETAVCEAAARHHQSTSFCTAEQILSGPFYTHALLCESLQKMLSCKALTQFMEIYLRMFEL